MVDSVGSKDFLSPLPTSCQGRSDQAPARKQRDGEAGVVWSYYLEAKDQHGGKSGRQLIKEFLKTVQIPDNRSIGYEKDQALDEAGNPTADVSWKTVYMERRAGISGEYVESANVANDQSTGQPYVSLTFSQAGAKFRRLDRAERQAPHGHPARRPREFRADHPGKDPGGTARITLGGYEAYKSCTMNPRPRYRAPRRRSACST